MIPTSLKINSPKRADMANEFTPKQLNITSALGREKAEARLTVYGDSMAREGNIAIKQAWYLVQHTDVTGRMNGEGAMAYRRLSGYQLAKLVCEVANQNIMGADVTAYMYKFMGISLEVAAVVESEKPKTTLTWEAARDLLAEDPNRIDIFLPYANSARVVTSIRRENGYWDVVAGGWRMSFDGNSIAYMNAPAPDATPASSTPDSEAAGDTVADSAAPVSSVHVSNSAIPVTVLTDDLLAASREQWNERAEGLIADSEIPFAEFDKPSIWTHFAADSIRNMLASADPIRVNYVLRISGAASVANGMTGHGRNRTKTAKSRVLHKPMAKVTQIPNMQRVKAFKPFSVENTAMPIAPLTIVPKVTKAALTRWLETRNRRAA
jgi:hypothetical protein